MTPNKIYSLLLAGILAAFFIGLAIAPNDSNQIREQYEKERSVILESIRRKQVQVTRLQADSIAIRKKMYSDSLKFSLAYTAEKQAKQHYKKLYEQVDLSRYTVPELDSLRAALRRPLHPH